MRVSIEYYIFVNFSMNALSLLATARGVGKVRLPRVALAAALGTAYAVAANLPGCAFLRGLAFRLAVTLAMAAIALRPEGFFPAARGTAVFLCSSVLIGGAQLAANAVFQGSAWASLLLGGAAGAAAITTLFWQKVSRVEKWEVEVIVRKRGHQARFTALIDTGNRLREPLSGLPVLIVEQSRIEALLPREPHGPESRAGMRRVAFGGVGGNGFMRVFRPDDLWVNYSDGWMRAPELWIGIFPGKLPGSVCALAPAVLGAIGAEREGGIRA